MSRNQSTHTSRRKRAAVEVVGWVDTSEDEAGRRRAAEMAVNALFGVLLCEDADGSAEQGRAGSSERIGVAARERYSALNALATRPDARPDWVSPTSLEGERSGGRTG